jgi:hypothetical protein
MGAFGDIGTRGLLFDAQQQPMCSRAIGSLVLPRGLWGLGCRGMRLGRSEVSERAGIEFIPENDGGAGVRMNRQSSHRRRGLIQPHPYPGQPPRLKASSRTLSIL